jgi:guanylate kinase
MNKELIEPIGKLIVISGPAGCGKDTIVEGLFAKNSELFYSISTTTRSPREGEQDGVHYFFTSREEFGKMIKKGDFLEYTQYCGNYYGTRKATIMTALGEGKNIILKIECEGAENVKKMFPEALLIFVMPPSVEELRRRLVNRSTEDEKTIERRIRIAQTEIAFSGRYDYKVINDDLQTAINEVAEIILK